MSGARVTRPTTESTDAKLSDGATRTGHDATPSASRGTGTPAGTSWTATTTARAGSGRGVPAALSVR